MALKDSYYAVKIEYHNHIAQYINCNNEAEAITYLHEIEKAMNEGKRVYAGSYLKLVSLDGVRVVHVIDHDEGYYPAKLDPDTLFKLTGLK